METRLRFKRKLEGVVVSDKSAKTLVVNVSRKYMHPKYNKFLNRRKNYHVHDEASLAKVGDKVLIIESRPHSKLKTWELIKVL